MLYAKVVVKMGVRTECKNCDFSDILEDEDVRIWLFDEVVCIIGACLL